MGWWKDEIDAWKRHHEIFGLQVLASEFLLPMCQLLILPIGILVLVLWSLEIAFGPRSIFWEAVVYGSGLTCWAIWIYWLCYRTIPRARILLIILGACVVVAMSYYFFPNNEVFKDYCDAHRCV